MEKYGGQLQLLSAFLALLEVRSERLEVRNGFAAFAGVFHICGSDRGKRQEIDNYNLARTFQNAHLASCFWVAAGMTVSRKRLKIGSSILLLTSSL